MTPRQNVLTTAVVLISTSMAFGQNRPPDNTKVPIYTVTVVERTINAVDYRYRGGPTSLNFRGTVLLPHAKGEAQVESKAGRTEIDAKFDRVEAPTRYGKEYLTYVLWAISPEGHAKNLGELMPGSSDHAKLHVTTDLQAFGMLVTAEPYSAVRQPSDVVVLENVVRPDTIGGVEPISAKYELLPRGQYTYNVPSDLTAGAAKGEMLPMDRYESLLEVYQAQNAIQIAKAAGADRYATDTFNKAERLYETARDGQMRKADRTTIVTAARQAAQTAEDARIITERRMQDEKLAASQEQIALAEEKAARERELRLRAEADAQAARSQASAERSVLEEERSSRLRAEEYSAAARAVPPPPPAPISTNTTIVESSSGAPVNAQQMDMRMRLARELNGAMTTRDTPRGLVVSLPDSDFRGTSLNPSVYGALLRVAAAIRAHPGLNVQVEGHTDNSLGETRAEEYSYARAVAVRSEMARAGVPATSVSARGYGSTRPLASNASASGREQNRRVEITITGDSIGDQPSWNKTYSLAPQR